MFNLSLDLANDKENRSPGDLNIAKCGEGNGCSSDLKSQERIRWITSQLHDINITLDIGESMGESAIKCIQDLLQERYIMKEQAVTIGEENSSMRVKLQSLERAADVQTSMIQTLKQDIVAANNRCSAVQNEFRACRTQWTAEKTELEGKVFQAQSLQTQMAGSVRKKEKDFDKLQTQLAKMIRDSQKAVKSACVVSKPMPKSFSSTAALRPASFRDAEITALYSSLQATNDDNNSLKQTMVDLTTEIAASRAALTAAQIELTRVKSECSPPVLKTKAPFAPNGSREGGSYTQNLIINGAGAMGAVVEGEDTGAMDELQNQLQEALRTVEEQERLLRLALRCDADACVLDEDNWELEGADEAGGGLMCSPVRLRLREFEEEWLPPASPTTMRLLQLAGCEVLPNLEI